MEGRQRILGLTSQEVEDRIYDGLVNEEVETSTKSIKDIVKSNIFTFFNFIFVVLAILLIFVGSFKDLSFMLLVIINTVIGIVQEIRSKNILDNLKFDKMPKVEVLRDGEVVEVPAEDLVLDDVILLYAGNKIPADARVLRGSVTVNESMLTGEQDEIAKTANSELMSGSYIISGECIAVLTAVGEDSYISKLTIEATKQKKNDERSEMVKSLDRLVKVIGILVIPIGIILVGQQYFINGDGLRSSIISMVAAVLGMIPEGLFMMASIALVVSAMRLAKQQVLVQNMRCIETLARVDVLCVDKTGTITENEMRVSELIPITQNIDEKSMAGLVGDIAHAMSKDNITMAALQDYFEGRGERKAIQICPFSSKYKYCGAVFQDGNFVLGAPEYVLGGYYDRYKKEITEISNQGYRVLALVASSEVPQGQTLTASVSPIALVTLENPIREAAKPTFEYFAENGVDVKVISGDNPVTVSNVALNAGIKGAEKYVDARTLTSPELIDDALMRYTVFGRVTPEQKRMFVNSLKKQSKTVGMTGDGVNDILALRDADCSIAMASGSEAASNAAQLVLLDSDFSKMPSVVAEGRRVVNNIIKTATLYLTKNIFSFLLAIFSMVSVLQYPLQPSQITLISMFTIGIPSFVLSLEPNRERIKGGFLRNVFKMAFPAGLTVFIIVSLLLVFGQVLELDQSNISTASSALVALVEFLILARVAKPMNKLHIAMLAVMIGAFFYMIIFHNEVFGISALNWQCALLLIVFLLATVALFRILYTISTGLQMILTREGREMRKRKQAETKKKD